MSLRHTALILVATTSAITLLGCRDDKPAGTAPAPRVEIVMPAGDAPTENGGANGNATANDGNTPGGGTTGNPTAGPTTINPTLVGAWQMECQDQSSPGFVFSTQTKMYLTATGEITARGTNYRGSATCDEAFADTRFQTIGTYGTRDDALVTNTAEWKSVITPVTESAAKDLRADESCGYKGWTAGVPHACGPTAIPESERTRVTYRIKGDQLHTRECIGTAGVDEQCSDVVYTRTAK